ncbi:MAG: aminotransferase class III-fold pyridoxal phosphate-dependent enzyme [Clostridiales bacterium]|nr:aminotransferase class III-fold pyridoxal phosphate-dependent enzyme [Clostridiales bacterium]
MRANEKSLALYERASKSIAGGHLSNFKQHPGNPQTFFSHFEGSKMFDVDGNMYYDWSLSSGPAILGQASPIVRDAIIEQAQKCYTRQYMEVQIEAAELFCKCVPCADSMHYAVTGGESMLYTIRTARAYTGKNMIVRFNGMYHGGTDLVLGGRATSKEDRHVLNGWDEGDSYGQACFTTGRAKHALNDVYMIDYNDLEQMEALFKSDDDIACVILEPVCLNISGCMPEPGYLEGVRKLCDEYGVLLVFDETLTGFRAALGGAQEYFGITPDLATFAKAISGGIPGAAFGGKAEVMKVLDDCTCIIPGTYNGNSLTAAVMKAVLTELSRNDGECYKQIEKLGNMFREGVLDAAKKYDIPMLMQGFPGAWFPVFTEKDRIRNHREALLYSDLDKMHRFGSLMKENGVIGDDRYCVSLAHTESDVLASIEIADKVLSILKEEQ